MKCPDELHADFARFYRVYDMRELGVARAASLCAAMIRQPESWTHRALNPDWQWGLLHNQWGVPLFDAVQWLQWAQTNDGQKGRNRPAPFPRPQTSKPAEYQAMDVDALDAYLDRAFGRA